MVPVPETEELKELNREKDDKNDKCDKDEWLILTIGKVGKWQWWIIFLLSLFKMPINWSQTSIVFLAPPTQFWCAPPPEYKNMTQKLWIELIQPFNLTDLDKLNNGFCEMKSLKSPNEIEPCPFGYNYNRSIFKSSIITEWNLVCSRERLVDISQITIMTGTVIGSVIFGTYADRYGRKPIFVICILIQTIIGFVISWSPWYWSFVLSRFILGMAEGGSIVITTVIGLEIVAGKWRAIMCILIHIFYGLGYSMMGVLAYFFREWREFYYSMATISCVFILLIWWIPESPRWLFVKGRDDEAKRLLQRAAKFNGIGSEEFERKFEKIGDLPRETDRANIMDLFLYREICRRTFMLSFIWLASGMTFFTMNQYMGHISRDIFLSTIITGVLSVPGQILCIIMVGKLGRRSTIAVGMLVVAVSLVSINAFPKGVYPNDWQRILFACIVVKGISISWCAAYLFTGELYPTVLRNTGLGVCSMCARIGSMLSPMVVALHNTAPYLPLLLLGAMNLLGMALTLTLPETSGKELPELISDIELKERYNRKQRLKEKCHAKVSTM